MTKGSWRVNSDNTVIQNDGVQSMESIQKGSDTGKVIYCCGGVPVRFKTEAQRKLWLRLRAKQDAKTEN